MSEQAQRVGQEWEFTADGCPWCYTIPTEADVYCVEIGGKQWQVICSHCDARGPAMPTSRQAKLAWLRT